jgi:hypothetical protein
VYVLDDVMAIGFGDAVDAQLGTLCQEFPFALALRVPLPTVFEDPVDCALVCIGEFNAERPARGGAADDRFGAEEGIAVELEGYTAMRATDIDVSRRPAQRIRILGHVSDEHPAEVLQAGFGAQVKAQGCDAAGAQENPAAHLGVNDGERVDESSARLRHEHLVSITRQLYYDSLVQVTQSFLTLQFADDQHFGPLCWGIVVIVIVVHE